MVRETREAPVEADREAAPPRRRRYLRRREPAAEGTRDGPGAAGAAALAVTRLAQLIRLIAWLLAALIVLGILFIVLDANPDNSIVSAVHDAARWLVGPFDGMFKPHDRKLAIAINWGIAAIVYVIVGSLIASLVTRASMGMRRRAAG
jgi:membrane-bound ClpP family serine protease